MMKTKDELQKDLRRQTRMVQNRDHKIEQLQTNLKVAHKDLKAAQKELKVSCQRSAQQQQELERQLLDSQEQNDFLKKKLSSQELHQESIAQHHYSDFIVSFAVELCAGCGCSLRQVSQILELVNVRFHLNLPKIPCYTSVKNWSEKVGYFIYTDPDEKTSLVQDGDSYALIVDESMKIGGQKNLVMLGVSAEKTGEEALTASDVTVLAIDVQSSWNSRSVADKLAQVEQEVGQSPAYIISDNASTLAKAIRDEEHVSIRDVGHTVALGVQHVYEKDPEFVSLMKDVSLVKSQEVMRPTAVLLPPKQRTISRFMNLFGTIQWAFALLGAFTKLNEEEQKVYGFLFRYETLIKELHDLYEVINSVLECLKTKGLSRETAEECFGTINRLLSSTAERGRAMGGKLRDYMNEEVSKLPKNKLPEQQVTWNCSSDIIESLFGWDKRNASPNKMNGITTRILLLPLLTRLEPRKGKENINYKKCLEKVTMANLRTWKNKHLLENQMIKRRILLKDKNTISNPV
jgi:transposase-like protein